MSQSERGQVLGGYLERSIASTLQARTTMTRVSTWNTSTCTATRSPLIAACTYAILIDLELGTMDSVRAGPCCTAHSSTRRLTMWPRTVTEGCDCLQSFQLCHFIGGGTASASHPKRRPIDVGLIDYLVKCQIQDALKLTVRELGHWEWLYTTPQDTETIPFRLEVHLLAVSLRMATSSSRGSRSHHLQRCRER